MNPFDFQVTEGVTYAILLGNRNDEDGTTLAFDVDCERSGSLAELITDFANEYGVTFGDFSEVLDVDSRGVWCENPDCPAHEEFGPEDAAAGRYGDYSDHETPESIEADALPLTEEEFNKNMEIVEKLNQEFETLTAMLGEENVKQVLGLVGKTVKVGDTFLTSQSKLIRLDRDVFAYFGRPVRISDNVVLFGETLGLFKRA